MLNLIGFEIEFQEKIWKYFNFISDRRIKHRKSSFFNFFSKMKMIGIPPYLITKFG